ncbi:MAG: glycosyltransferase family 1 protein [Candidatus Rifleibacteriota bacterium]
MKILINAVSARAGGGVSYLLNLLQILPRIAPEFEILAVVPDNVLPNPFIYPKNLEIKIIRAASGNVFKRFLWENTELIKLCREWQADLLFCVANVIPLRKPPCQVVVIIQNVAPFTPRVFKQLKRFEPITDLLRMYLLKILGNFAIRNSDQVISLSHATARLLKKFTNKKSEVLYHGISDNFSPEHTKSNSSIVGPYFLYVSNLYVYKGLEYIIEALQTDPELPAVYVAGYEYDKGYMQWIRQLIEKADLQKKIVFLNSVSQKDLPTWYANAAALVYPSWCENCPNILLEAMGCGCPIVAMDIGPMPEIAGEVGFFARPFDGKSLAEQMKKALLEGQQKKSLAIARARLFTWNKSMKSHKEIFMKVLKAKKDQA